MIATLTTCTSHTRTQHALGRLKEGEHERATKVHLLVRHKNIKHSIQIFNMSENYIYRTQGIILAIFVHYLTYTFILLTETLRATKKITLTQGICIFVSNSPPQ